MQWVFYLLALMSFKTQRSLLIFQARIIFILKFFQYWETVFKWDTSAVFAVTLVMSVPAVSQKSLWQRQCAKKVLDSETCVCVRLAGQRKSRTALIPSFPRLLSLTTTLRWCRSWGLKCTTLTVTTAVCKMLTSWENWSVPWDRLALFVYHKK